MYNLPPADDDTAANTFQRCETKCFFSLFNHFEFANILSKASRASLRASSGMMDWNALLPGPWFREYTRIANPGLNN
jgi:hypothetical protein